MLSEVRHFAHDAWIRFYPGWLDVAEAQALFEWMRARVSFEQAVLRVFGREVKEPRLSAWFGDVEYRYSGRHLRPTEWPRELDDLRTRVEASAEARFNAALVNRYRDGNDGMGFHSDDEPELGINPTIASLSLGAVRRFIVRPKRKQDSAGGAEYDLGAGSLLIMGGSLQHHFRHALPKNRASTGERINLTFRWIHAAPH